MDVQFYGANCIAFSTKGVRVVVDDNLVELGGKSVLRPGDIALYTGAHEAPKVEAKLVVEHGGEYEVSDVSIYGIPARSHMDEEGRLTATMYKVISKEVSIFFPGHVYPELTGDQLESIGMIDIMCIPVGGNGYTLDPVGALKVIKKIEPKVLIPTHYDDKTLKFPVPQQTLEQALSALSMEPTETTPKLKFKAGELGDTMQLIILERS